MMGDFRDCWLPGWTVLEGGPTVLLKYHIDILNISSCNQLEDKLSSAIFCVKVQMGEEGICKGDVGSPLICPDPKGGAWLQLGVLSSFDEACSRPYVFSSLSHYLPWLEKITKIEGHRYNLSVPWERLGPARNLRLLREPETLVGWISAHSSLPWQALVATCANVTCGGSILSRYWVLTTAQCMREADPEGTAVFVGLMHPKGHIKGVSVAGIYISNNSSVALLLLQRPITFNKYITRMASSPTASWDSCKVMGLQILQSGEIQANPSAYQVKVLLPSDCAKEYPGVEPAMFCIVNDNSSYLPAEAVGEGAALLCRLESKSTSWRQVGFVSAPLPGYQAVILSSCISSYADWIEETSKRAKHLVHLSHGSGPCRPNVWLLLLILSLLEGTELG
uniref:Peptidase S1 domain-containing protein n=2 Tax=Anolis carolinensis TaxID=28377 RepID=G1KX12_ANOCA|nr:PREDICTED: serine protease 55 [Anolis carolinensis]|eukprot:XP_016854056.1 PREDICTED: serine protease 55 [Anolis carolinensis]